MFTLSDDCEVVRINNVDYIDGIFSANPFTFVKYRKGTSSPSEAFFTELKFLETKEQLFIYNLQSPGGIRLDLQIDDVHYAKITTDDYLVFNSDKGFRLITKDIFEFLFDVPHELKSNTLQVED